MGTIRPILGTVYPLLDITDMRRATGPWSFGKSTRWLPDHAFDGHLHLGANQQGIQLLTLPEAHNAIAQLKPTLINQHLLGQAGRATD